MIRMRFRSTGLSALAACAAILPLASSPVSAQHAHTHGVAELNAAFDGNMLVIEMEVPSGDVVGFERAAETAEEEALIEEVLASLQRPDAVLVLAEEAGCEIKEAEAEFEIEGNHAAFHVHQHYACAAPDALGASAVPLFEAYPDITEVEAVVVGRGVARPSELEPGDTLDLSAQ